jgi:hypothetical protein
MFVSLRRPGLVLPAVLIAVAAGTALASPAQALTGWSPPVQLPGACGAALAVNAAGTEVAAGSQQNSGLTPPLQACTSADGQNWSAPVTVGQGLNPVVAIAPDGRAVVVWRDGASGEVSASVRPPGGQWGPAVTVSGGPQRDLGVGIDGSGNVIAAWMDSNSAVETASLPVGARKWTKITILAARGQAVDLAVNATGAAIITWATGTAAFAASGTVLGGFGAPVTLGPPPGYPIGHTRVVLNGQGDAAAAWVTSAGPSGADLVATRSPDGSWAPAVTLSTTPDGRIDVAIDGAGDARAIFGQLSGTNPYFFSVAYTSARPAGGTWSTPALLSAPGDATTSPHVVADAAGTFVASWVDNTTGLTVLTSPPGGGFGPATTFAGAFGDLKIAPGHAVLSFTSAASMSVSTEPVS